ncbi:hypothetical protein ANO11243_020700 [Dothideomycetidae sp. 11243]|nr:hypothetical protein ANO11243_020700 [fungal sp. No.11243]
MGDVLDDEVVSLNAIYDGDTFCRLSDDPIVYALTLPGEYHIALRLEFPKSYPDAPPSILGTQSIGDNLQKGFGTEAVNIARDVLAQVYVVGSPCIYDLVEDLTVRLQQALSAASEQTQASVRSGDDQTFNEDGQKAVKATGVSCSDQTQTPAQVLEGEPPWILSETVSEKRSTFVARAARVTSRTQAETFLAHLLSTNKSVSQATHNITAWRIRGEANTAFQDCDDDGEAAAGGRLLRLLQLMDVWNVMVVVSRWYGGVQLGPARFRIINSVARDVLVQGGFDEDGPKDTSLHAPKRSEKKTGKR